MRRPIELSLKCPFLAKARVFAIELRHGQSLGADLGSADAWRADALVERPLSLRRHIRVISETALSQLLLQRGTWWLRYESLLVASFSLCLEVRRSG